MQNIYIPKNYRLTDLFHRFCFHILEQEQGRMKAAHVGMYFYLLNLNRKMKWNRNVGVPTAKAMKMLSIKSDDTFYKFRDELIGLGLIELVHASTSKVRASVFTLHTKKLGEFSKAEWLKEFCDDRTSAENQPKPDVKVQNRSKKEH